MTETIFKDPLLVEEIKKYARRKSVVRDDVLMSPGSDIVFVPIVTKGILRIVRENEDGREMFLYHLYPGQTCAMAINCCQSGKKSMVKAIAEEDTEVLMIPVDRVEEWFKYSEWKLFINNTYSLRFAELIKVIDLIAFSHMDQQLLHYLEERAKAMHTNAIVITHQQIADELRTHREAISRLLRSMEEKGLVRLGRNTIELL
jgi:CRP/FNR family transcriptional regulator